ncbi:hypothetical protein [Paenibacillus sp. 1781tsa1]|uniref:hypothetical protein n=1 Tax=Paenibacillus sp. 1781tsa1 TaxID=2953810 RepID=UPI00209C86A4|nr:hypothetical protein [Paenibacillus sp. 1781tsa1]MCP1184967.1 hypothetical protein [Paenibacillus sp. 1781tsa1]
MKNYFVYTNEPELLEVVGSVYYPKIKMSYVIFTTDLETTEIWKIPSVYEVRECEMGRLDI